MLHFCVTKGSRAASTTRYDVRILFNQGLLDSAMGRAIGQVNQWHGPPKAGRRTLLGTARAGMSKRASQARRHSSRHPTMCGKQSEQKERRGERTKDRNFWTRSTINGCVGAIPGATTRVRRPECQPSPSSTFAVWEDLSRWVLFNWKKLGFARYRPRYSDGDARRNAFLLGCQYSPVASSKPLALFIGSTSNGSTL